MNQRPFFDGAARLSKMGEARSEQFFFGAATSAHQVEGGNKNDWSEWELQNAKRLAQNAEGKTWPDYILNPPGRGPNPLQEENYISGRAADHYHRFREDFDIAKTLDHNAHRFSIEWSRIEPKEGRFDEKEIEHYAQVIRALRECGLEPFVTLWHWTLPIWLAKKGGVLNKDFSDYFSRYVSEVTKVFAKDITFWITVNEPEIYAGASYYKGIWPPGKKNIFLFMKTINALADAHNRVYKEMKSVRGDFQIGIAKDNIDLDSTRWNLVGRLAQTFRKFWDNNFLQKIDGCQDFIGLNYYFHRHFGYVAHEDKSDVGWPLFPPAIAHILKELKKYNLPIYITENGIADARDAHRAKFIREHIEWMKKAMDEGVDVRGYFYWSLLDNFEWGKGFWPRFGLVEIDYKTMKRAVRPSALEYKKIIDGWKNI